jgi:phenylalanyl-tRNA synthetase beta chain
MKASYTWIRSLAPGLETGVKELAERFTAAGLEVEGIHEYGAGTESCVLAWVVSSRQHPSKSGLKLVTVDRGGSLLEIVCGAPNVPEPGAVVVLAPLGTHLPAKAMTIERRDIGGVVSEGMLCSEAELGLSEDAAGIIVFPPGFAEPGARFVDVVPEARDTIFEIGLTPNRPDALGHLGLAREAAALFGVPWKAPAAESPMRRGERTVEQDLTVQIDDAERCPHYGAALVMDATIAASPPATRFRLAALGVRSISNVVDVTNLVMLEYGHPMHAFDADKVRGKRIVVRRARAGESLVTLDGVTRSLDPDDLVIADAEAPIALAGVMGGFSSEITPSTKRIVLECAYFDPRGVRRTARRHGLHSESSHRFERGIDYGDTREALEHSLGMTCRLTSGVGSKDLLIVRAREIATHAVRMQGARMRSLLGVDVPLGEAKATLERLGFSCKEDGDTLVATVPSHRPDVSRDVDVMDEVVRVRGMASVPATLPAIRASRAVGGREALFRRARHAATSLGLYEALTFGFTSEKTLSVLGAATPLRIDNPLTADRDAMRTSLLPGLFDAVRYARRRGVGNIRLFTTGSLFFFQRELVEKPVLAVALAGNRPAHLHKPEPYDVWDAKGVATALVSRIARATITVTPGTGEDYLNPRGAAGLFMGKVHVGSFGPIHPDVEDALDLGGPVLVVELALDALAEHAPTHATYVPIPRHPTATRDIALVVRDGVPAGDLLRALEEVARANDPSVNVTVELFDRFVGGSVRAGHTSLAFHVVYQADRTLTDADVDATHAKVVAEMQRRFGASLRG